MGSNKNELKICMLYRADPRIVNGGGGVNWSDLGSGSGAVRPATS